MLTGKNKKGELTSQQIVILIILVASFAVLLYFLMQLGLGKQTESEVCHNSVVMRGSSVTPTEVVPLDCQRKYVCVTADGSCEKMTKPIKEKVKTKEEVYEVLAKEMADCWWMFGEGKVNYMGKDFTENLYCSICSQIAFDDSVSKDIKEFKRGELDREEFYKYLTLTKIPRGEVTYAKYLFNTNDLSKISGGVPFGNMSLTGPQYYVLMGITSKINTLGWVAVIGVGTAVAGGVIASSVLGGGPIWIAVGAGTGAAIGGTAGAMIPQKYLTSTREGESGNEYLLPTLIEAGSDIFKDLRCDYIVSKS